MYIGNGSFKKNSPYNPRRRLHHNGSPMPCRHKLCRAQKTSRRHRCCCCCCCYYCYWSCCCCWSQIGQTIAAAGVAIADVAATAAAAWSAVAVAAVALQGKNAFVSFTFPSFWKVVRQVGYATPCHIAHTPHVQQLQFAKWVCCHRAVSPTRNLPLVTLAILATLATRGNNQSTNDAS